MVPIVLHSQFRSNLIFFENYLQLHCAENIACEMQVTICRGSVMLIMELQAKTNVGVTEIEKIVNIIIYIIDI